MPAWHASCHSSNRHSLKEEHVESPGHTILVTERNGNIRELLRRELGRAGYRVLTAADAPTAREILRENASVELVILDEELPNAGEEGGLAAFFRGAGGPPVILHAFSQGACAYREDGQVAAVVEKGGGLELLTAAVARIFAA
ncbi:response regulator [Desulfolutivibrio sp.]|uniref:response regulator n=1 Tax=Desulfolutivibrio sp. TaxID=2773296 RepID=UPI002F9697CC